MKKNIILFFVTISILTTFQNAESMVRGGSVKNEITKDILWEISQIFRKDAQAKEKLKKIISDGQLLEKNATTILTNDGIYMILHRTFAQIIIAKLEEEDFSSFIIEFKDFKNRCSSIFIDIDRKRLLEIYEKIENDLKTGKLENKELCFDN